MARLPKQDSNDRRARLQGLTVPRDERRRKRQRRERRDGVSKKDKHADGKTLRGGREW